MLDKLSTYILYGKQFCGLEHSVKDGSTIIYGTLIKRSKKELDIVSSIEAKSIEEVSSDLPKQQHAVLVINDGNVLTKKVTGNAKESLKLVYNAFPNINIDDFYYQVLPQRTHHFVSLCRKDVVHSIISSYSDHGVYIVDVKLGNSPVVGVTTYIEDAHVLTSNAKVHIEDHVMTDIDRDVFESKNYMINGLTIASRYILSFSVVLQQLLNSNPTDSNFDTEREDLTTAFEQRRFFSQFIKLAGLFILSVLLINFFAFNHYFNKVNALQQVSTVNQSTKQQILLLDEVVSKKQKMVDDLLKSQGSKSSWYGNTIMESLPKTMLLSELNYQPLMKRIKADKPIELENDIIIISGTSNDSERFSQWISRLEALSWVNQVTIEDYGSTSPTRTDFTIKIILADDA